MKNALTILAGLSLASAIPATAWAHGGSHALHGGIVQMNGETMFELVRAPAGVSLYVLEEDEPVNAKAMTAKLSVNVAGRRQDVTMVSGSGNQFFAKGLKLAKGVKVGVMVVNNATQSRFGANFVIK